MRTFHLLPKGQQQIEEQGIDLRVERYFRTHGRPDIINISEDSLVQVITMMREDGYFATMPSHLKRPYRSTLNNVFKEDACWKVNGKRVRVELQDILILSGYLASLVMTPQELWSHERFSFTSPLEFAGTVGAYLFQQTARSQITNATEVIDPFSNNVLYVPRY